MTFHNAFPVPDVAKLICALLSTNNKDINLKLQELTTVNVLLDLFFKYSLNNFLHAQVEQCIRLVFAFNNPNFSVVASEDGPRSPTIRVQTPPTVEMVETDEAEEEGEKSEDTSPESVQDDKAGTDETQTTAADKKPEDKQESSDTEAATKTPPTSPEKSTESATTSEDKDEVAEVKASTSEDAAATSSKSDENQNETTADE